MQTLRAAGDLLIAAESIDRLVPIAKAIGCAGEPSPFDTGTRHALGLPPEVDHALIAAGAGSLRALLLEFRDGAPLRDTLSRLASRLSTRAPHILWIVVATQPATGDVAILAWSDDRRPPRVAALVANRSRLVDSDAEALRALAAASHDHDLLTHTRWVEILGREALTVRFYRALERALAGLADSSTAGARDVREEIALLHVSRLLFLSFLEAKGWLDGDRAFVARQFDACMARGGHFQRRVLLPLFFGTLNTPHARRAPASSGFGRVPFLNGGLFGRTPIERRNRSVVFSDEAFGHLIANVFAQYRFTAREESADWSEAAVDPEMLGRAFESLMGSDDRRRTGAFYTPFALVEQVANAGLEAALARSNERDPRRALMNLTVLDPACGSGAFLVHVLERIAAGLAHLGDDREAGTIRRDVLTRSIYGVDINPTAVWLCELRLWLSVVIESHASDPERVPPLPNLDRNVRVGDSLSGRGFGSEDRRTRGVAGLWKLRQRYAKASGARKESLGRQLDRVERSQAVQALDRELALIAARRRDLLVARRGRDLFGEPYRPSRDERETSVLLRRRAAETRALRKSVLAGGALPFSFPVHFANVAARGFDLVIGNPPWVRLHRVPVEQRAAFRRDYEVARSASWEPGATSAGAGRGFSSQVDVASLFVERSVGLLAPGGAMALLLPVKLWRSLAGGGVRRFLNANTHILRIEDFSEARASFDAAVYPSLVVATRHCGERTAVAPCVVTTHHRGKGALSWRLPPDDLAFDKSAGAPWILLPPDPRRAFDRLRDRGRPLPLSPIGRPLLGVKCGCNDAFIVELLSTDTHLADVRARNGRQFTIERELLRPLIRGEHLQRWKPNVGREQIIWTHDATDAPLAELPRLAARWFARWRRDLIARTDARHRARWWSLFRTESARCDAPRVVWGDLGREPRASVLVAGDNAVALNSCYVARCHDDTDAHALAALLNGPVARAWLNTVAEPARGGYRRYLGWTLSLLPTPPDWSRARRHFAPIGRRAVDGQPPTEMELVRAALAAYKLDADDVAPLIAWLGE